jgi:hypothetical protein
MTSINNDIKFSNNAKSGYWLITSQPSYNGKWKALIPNGKGKMIKKENGGGLFNTAIEAAIALKIYCKKNNINYN